MALLHGWVDAKHGWVKPGRRPRRTGYFTLIHGRDNFFVRTCHAYHALDLVPPCPLAAFPTLPLGTTNPSLVENRAAAVRHAATTCSISSRFPARSMAVNDPYHASTSRDGWIARETDGTPNKKLVNAWRSVLGDNDADTWLDEKDNCKRVVNDQIDTDGDGIGDACDTTTIHVPGHVTADATGPAGAIVPYSVTVTDANNLVCTPATGSLFAIGATTVTCTANDSGENKATASFTVTVLGAKEQLAESGQRDRRVHASLCRRQGTIDRDAAIVGRRPRPEQAAAARRGLPHAAGVLLPSCGSSPRLRPPRGPPTPTASGRCCAC